MFTGIVQAQATITDIRPIDFGRRLLVNRANWKPAHTPEPEPGDSICISGVCLTVVERQGDELHFEVIAETLTRTTLGDLQPGSPVNLEPALAAGQPLGGHFMQGHIDAVGTVVAVDRGDEECRITIEPPAELMDYIAPKGSIAIDGVSLTLAAVYDSGFEVALIPTTLALTTLGRTAVGDRVNLEADILSKTVVHYLRRRQQQEKPTVTPQTLAQAGFLP